VGTTLQHHAEVTAALQRTANGLQEALANTNARGQWGERMADDILAASGLIDGINYVKRTALAGEARGIPDFTFILPDQHVMFMDVKFPIDSYLAYLQASTDVERAQHLDAFLRAVRGHVKALAKRDYVNNDDRPAVDNVLMFVPNESIVSFIHQHAPTLVDEAMQQHVVLCSPLNLFVFLGVVRQAFDSFRIAQTSRQMLALLGRFAKEWDNYATQVDKVRKQLSTAVASFDTLATTRRRQLERPLRELDQLRREEHVEIEGGWTTVLADEFEALPPGDPET
jgi:DNA recombination protein RmuC